MADRLARIRGDEFEPALVSRTAQLLKDGSVIVHPTETIHGYGCRWDSAASVERIRRLKGRRAAKPMILLVPDPGWIDRLCSGVSPLARRLVETFWPGALTLVFRSAEVVRSHPAWNVDTIALRQSSHPFTSVMLRLAGLPIVSTSLGVSGRAVPANAGKFMESLFAGHEFDENDLPNLAVIDVRLKESASPSTILSVTEPERVVLLREGAIPAEKIERTAGVELLKER